MSLVTVPVALRFYLLFTGVIRFLTKGKSVAEMSEKDKALLRKNA